MNGRPASGGWRLPRILTLASGGYLAGT